MSLFKSSILFSSGTVISRLTGLLREVVIAWTFGAGILVDAFIIANRIPNLLRELLAEGALGSSFTTVFTKIKAKNPEKANLFFYQALFWFFVVSSSLALLGIVFAPQVVGLFTLIRDDRANDRFIAQTIGLTRLLFPFLAFMTVGSLASGVLHYHGSHSKGKQGFFFLSGIAPVALNCGYILGALVFAKLLNSWGPIWIEGFFADKSITGLALGVLVGGFFHMFILLYSALKLEKYSYSFREIFHFSDSLKKTLVLMFPMVIAGGVGQINILLNSNFATSLQDGAVAWLNYAFRVLQLPIGVFVIAVSQVALPSLTSVISQGSGSRDIADNLYKAISLVLWFIFPCFVFVVVNSEDIVRLLYQQGAFSSHDSSMTSKVLFYYSFSLFGYGCMKVLTTYYYATGRTNYPMLVGFFTIGLHFFALYFFTKKYGVNGVAISSFCTLSINGAFLFCGLIYDRLLWPWKKTFLTLFFLVFAAVASYYLQNTMLVYNDPWVKSLGSFKIQSFLNLLINGLTCCTVFCFFWFFSSRIKHTKDSL